MDVKESYNKFIKTYETNYNLVKQIIEKKTVAITAHQDILNSIEQEISELTEQNILLNYNRYNLLILQKTVEEDLFPYHCQYLKNAKSFLNELLKCRKTVDNIYINKIEPEEKISKTISEYIWYIEHMKNLYIKPEEIIYVNNNKYTIKNY